MRALNCLNDVIMCAINGIEAGDTKREAVSSISTFVEENYMRKATFGDLGQLPIGEAAMLNERFGMEFKVKNGKVSGVRFGGDRSDTNFAFVG